MFIDDERTELIPERITNVMRALQLEIMQDIVRRIKAVGGISRSADYQIQKLYQLGLFKHEVDQMLMKALDLSISELNYMYNEVIQEGYARDEELYKHVGVPFTPLEENTAVNQYIQAVYAQTKGEITNITQTTGFIDFDKGTVTPLNTYFINILDKSHAMVSSGAFTKEQAIAKAIQDMTNSGLRTDRYGDQWIQYDNDGKKAFRNRVDVAVRRAVMTGVNQVVGKVTDYNAEKLETEYFEVSAHATARPTHQKWQGRVYSKEELNTICGLGTVTGLQGANCYHHYDAFIKGVSIRVYSDEDLEEMERKANQKRTYNGKEYTLYEATQRQRSMETRLRVLNQRIALYKTAENRDKEEETQIKKRALTNEYRQFSKAMGLQEQLNRVYNPVNKSVFKERTYKKLETHEHGKEQTNNNANIPNVENELHQKPKEEPKEEPKTESKTESKTELTIGEQKAIYDYISPKSYILNEKLRNNKQLTDNELDMIKNLDSALVKFPKHNGTLYRSLLFNYDNDQTEFLSKFSIGKKITFNEYISTSKNSDYNNLGQVLIYIENSKTGRDISSINGDEQEVLYMRNSQFKVKNIVEIGDKVNILLEEYNE